MDMQIESADLYQDKATPQIRVSTDQEYQAAYTRAQAAVRNGTAPAQKDLNIMGAGLEARADALHLNMGKISAQFRKAMEQVDAALRADNEFYSRHSDVLQPLTTEEGMRAFATRVTPAHIARLYLEAETLDSSQAETAQEEYTALDIEGRIDFLDKLILQEIYLLWEISRPKARKRKRKKPQPKSKTVGVANVLDMLEKMDEPETHGASWLRSWGIEEMRCNYRKAVPARPATDTREARKAQPAVTNLITLDYDVDESGQLITEGAPQPLGKIIITGKPFGPPERYTHDAVCNLCTDDRKLPNGHYLVKLSEVCEYLYHSPRVAKTTLETTLNIIMKLKAERLTIDRTAEVKAMEGVGANGEPITKKILSAPILAIGRTARTETAKSFDVEIEITETPIIYEYCLTNRQIATYNRAVGDIREVLADGTLGAKIPYTPERLAIEEYLFRRVARIKRSRANTNKSILFNTVLEQSGTASASHKIDTERRRYIVAVLTYWTANGFIKGFTTDADEETRKRKNAVATEATILTSKKLAKNK